MQMQIKLQLAAVVLLGVATLVCGAEGLHARKSACQALRDSESVVVRGCVAKLSDGSFTFIKGEGLSEGCVAHGVYVDSAHTASNFGKLRLATFPPAAAAAAGGGERDAYSDRDQLFAVGYLEGYLTAARMYDHHSNLLTYFREMLNASLEEPLEWLEAQEAWVNQQVAANPDDPYWRLLGLVNTQFDGLVAGYQAAAQEDQQRRERLRGRQGQGLGQEGRRGGRARRLARAREGEQQGAVGGSEGAQQGGASGGAEDIQVGWLERRDLMFLNSNGDIYDIIEALDAGYGYGQAGRTAANTSSDVHGHDYYRLDVVQRDAGGFVAASRAWLEAQQEQGGLGQQGQEVLGVQGQEGGAEGAGSQGVEGRGRRRRPVPSWSGLDPDPERMALKLAFQGKCSALIKVTGDLGELLLGHSTHDSFTAMTRVYKHYDLAGLADPTVVARQMSFSSYPGELFSDDDWYLMSSGLVVTETTNDVYLADVYIPMTVQSVLSWQRIRLANWVARSGDEWIATFARHNSGTYNNQYMVVDTKRFVAHKEMQPGLLWVAEQLPGLLQAGDMTHELSRGYWPSYNVAYFPKIYEASGYPDMIARMQAAGAKKYKMAIKELMYQVSPRASIFRRDQGGVEGLEDMKRVMQYNDFANDPYANGSPIGAVCARGDLAHSKAAMPKGCYDSKVTSATLAAKLESEVVGGPTTQGQPPFSWSDPRWSHLPHRGMPDTFNFTFERMSPRELPTLPECEGAVQLQLQQLEQEGRTGQQHSTRAEVLVAAGQQGETVGSMHAGAADAAY